MVRRTPANNHQKYSCIKPEDVLEGVEYSFSFNPEDQPHFDRFYNMKLNTLSNWSDNQFDILTSLKYCTVNVYLEISSKARFHYHGVIKIHHIPNFYIHDLAKVRNYGTYEIDYIKDIEVWTSYVTKQKHIMEDYCNKHNMKYNVQSPMFKNK